MVSDTFTLAVEILHLLKSTFARTINMLKVEYLSLLKFPLGRTVGFLLSGIQLLKCFLSFFFSCLGWPFSVSQSGKEGSRQSRVNPAS